MRTTAMNPTSSTQSAAWPEGVIARYLTVGGATVDVRDFSDEEAAQAWCNGCDRYDTTDWPEDHPRFSPSCRMEHAADTARRWAQSHAESCRAMPRPEAGDLR